LGKAPEVWAELPDPDCIFVGGTGRAVSRIVEEAFRRLSTRGRLVVNVTSVENVSAVTGVLRDLSGEFNVWMINVARGVQQMERLRFESLSPTFLLAAVKG
jgi:precorrin-6Y C5,15-methyltransferase (decarboxylating)